jgi:acyl carrier protein
MDDIFSYMTAGLGQKIHLPQTKHSIKRLMLELLSVETKTDYSDLIKKLDVDIMCDTAVDSLNMVDIAIDLEDRLGIKIDDRDLIPERLRSLDKFADFLLVKVTERQNVARSSKERK